MRIYTSISSVSAIWRNFLRSSPIRRFAVILMIGGCCMFSKGVVAQTPAPLQQRTESVIDITGNWRSSEVFLPYIQTREPAIKDGHTKTFTQTLSLPKGIYTIRLDYDTNQDRGEGASVCGSLYDFPGLSIDGNVFPLKFEKNPPPEPRYQGPTYVARTSFEVTEDAHETTLSLTLLNTRVLRTRITSEAPVPTSALYRAAKPSDGGELLVARGIPFLLRKIVWRGQMGWWERGCDNGSLQTWKDGMTLDCGGAQVKVAHFLGMIHNIDIANGSWYTPKGDHHSNHFVGDKAGEIVVDWADGSSEAVPLIFGYNVWYGNPWDIIWHYNWWCHAPGGDNWDAMLFQGHDEMRDWISDGLALVDGTRLMGLQTSNSRYIFSLDLGGRAVKSIRVNGTPEYYDYPLISAITLETNQPNQALAELPAVTDEKPNALIANLKAIEGKSYEAGVEKIMHALYIFVDEYPKLKEPEKPSGYFGPDYDFRGTQEAIYAATYLYRNGPECASHVADSGVGCSSPVSHGQLTQYTTGMGAWFINRPTFGSLENWFKLYQERRPGQHPGGNNGWTRGVGELLREAVAFGYDKFADSYVKWMDHALMTEANPPHWNRCAGGPDYCTYKTMVGDTEERGNRENDGHGNCMWGRYMTYHWEGHSRTWNQLHWLATKASADWIGWQLDNDTIRPGVRKDVLYTESECAHGSYDIYSSYSCLHGLKLAIKMALELGKTDDAARWQKVYEQLRKGILDNLVDRSESGPIWHTEPDCDWQDHAHAMVPIHLATEGDTYTPLQDYAAGDDIDRRYLETSRNTYRHLMKDKNYNCLRMYGYGQGMMTQAALLLDEMNDATHFLNMLLTHCYLPRFAGWASPEGIILHKSGKYYLPVNGYMGQDSHLADSTKALRLTLGVDDNKPEHLRLVPRFPASWTRMSITRFPVLTGACRQQMDYEYSRNDNAQEFTFHFDQRPVVFSVRLGPLPARKRVARATLDRKKMDFQEQHSGDSDWVWVKDLAGQSGKLRIDLVNAQLDEKAQE